MKIRCIVRNCNCCGALDLPLHWCVTDYLKTISPALLSEIVCIKLVLE